MGGEASASDTRRRTDQRPRLPRVYVPRTLLWDRLDDATQNPMTLLVGPMGSGKSLGVSGWLESRGHPGSMDLGRRCLGSPTPA